MSEDLLKRLQAELQADQAKVEADEAALTVAESATITIRCVVAFGNFRPGDTLDIPAGAVFDQTHFAQVA